MAENRRLWIRFNEPMEKLRLHDASKNALLTDQAEVLDESFGGIALAVPAEAPVAVAQLVTIEMLGARMSGVIKNVQASIDGKSWRIGIEWIPPSPSARTM